MKQIADDTFTHEVAQSFIDDIEAVEDLLPNKGETEGDYFNRLKEIYCAK